MFRSFDASVLGTLLQQSEIIEFALSYGFKAIDLDIVEFSALVRLKGLPYARRLIDSAHIGIGTFALPVDWQAPEEQYRKALERLPEHCQNANTLGCFRAVSLINPVSETHPFHENFELHRRRLVEVCSILKEHSIQLAIGFRAGIGTQRDGVFQFIQKLEELLPLIQAVKAENLGLLADVWDIFVSQGNLDLLLSQPKESIVAVRLAELPKAIDLSQVNQSDRVVAWPGGRINCVKVLKWLAEGGFDGPVTPYPSRKALGTGRVETLARDLGLATLSLWHAAGLPVESRYATLLRASHQAVFV